MERIRQDLKKEKGIDASIQQVRAAVYVLVKRKKSTGTTKPSTTQKRLKRNYRHTLSHLVVHWTQRFQTNYLPQTSLR
jgi:hypothetical protein